MSLRRPEGDTSIITQMVLDLERKFNLEPSTHHELSARLQHELDRLATEGGAEGSEAPKSLGAILGDLERELDDLDANLSAVESDAYPEPDFYYTDYGRQELRNVDISAEEERVDAIDEARIDQTLEGLTIDSIESLTEQSNIVNLAYWSPQDLSNPEQVKQLSEDNTDLSMQALYKQKELRDVRDKIRKRRMDVNASTKDLQTATRGLVSLEKVRESKVKGKFTPDQWQEYDTLSKELRNITQKSMGKKFVVQHLILHWRPYWSEDPKFVDRMFKMCEEGRVVE